MRQRIVLLASVLVLVLGFALPSAQALQAPDPRALINDLVSQAIATIKDKQVSEQVRETKFRKLLERDFDIPRISRFVLGRYWRLASPADRQKFLSLFKNWVVSTYAARFQNYSGQRIKVTGTRRESSTSTVVLSQFINTNGAPPAKIEWHVLKEPDGGYKVVDVSVEGVSMALTQRDQIAAVADRNGGTIEGLNKALKARLSGKNTTAAK